MSLDGQSLFNMGASLLLTMIGWAASQVWSAVKDLQKDLRDIEVMLPRDYVAKDDLDKRMKHIEDMFQRIYDKLDGKVDKK